VVGGEGEGKKKKKKKRRKKERLHTHFAADTACHVVVVTIVFAHNGRGGSLG